VFAAKFPDLEWYHLGWWMMLLFGLVDSVSGVQWGSVQSRLWSVVWGGGPLVLGWGARWWARIWISGGCRFGWAVEV